MNFFKMDWVIMNNNTLAENAPKKSFHIAFSEKKSNKENVKTKLVPLIIKMVFKGFLNIN